ncbi:MAG: heme d1 biosynthesis radical SAM protein NirJ [Magnetococcales bacterium]|nr:heme d1 biosynthesis radical SAM protein NirJ [Magnetococcales bacterium]
MFRLTQLMRRLLQPDAVERQRVSTVTGPVVVWNLIRRCNLSCVHCYAASSDKFFRGELTGEEVFRILAELKQCGVSALILSGGEPLLRPDLFEIAAHAKGLGFYLGLSSNGTLMDEAMAKRIAMAGFDYVGVSLDGLEANHDRMRGLNGAFRRSLDGIRHCRQEGVQAGIRFTPTKENAADLPGLFQLMGEEGVDRLYLSHWNYAGRGRVHREVDADHQATRRIIEGLFELCKQDLESGSKREFVTGNNDADGVFFLLWVRRHLPNLAQRAEQMLLRWGGNASGVGIVNIDEQGEVHPDIFWRHYSLGNLRSRSFAEIWGNGEDALLTGLRQKPRPVKGRCGRCHYLAICGGNTRVRAYQSTGDHWEEDPGCYLTDVEIGF